MMPSDSLLHNTILQHLNQQKCKTPNSLISSLKPENHLFPSQSMSLLQESIIDPSSDPQSHPDFSWGNQGRANS